MADITNGITVSFMNTPQAVDDYYASSTTKLTEDTLASIGVLTLDVMSNDLGGKAKTLYSIDDANLSDDQSTYAYDLLQKDALTNGASVPEYSTFGAKIWIDNGKIKYDASAISGPSLAAINQLAAGESLNDTFTYAIRMSNGAISWATVSVQITGTNDLPTISVADDKGEVVEDATSPTLKDSGAITFDDVDLTDTHSTSVAKDLGNALGGTLTAVITDTATGAGNGTVTWSYEVLNSATQYLAKDETVDEKFTIKISDNHGGFVEQLVTVTVTGTNDGATISLADDKGAVTEDDDDPFLSDTGTITFDDVDLIDSHSVSSAADAGNKLGGTLTASITDSATGDGDGTVTWAYKVANSATQHLADGEEATEIFTVTIDDGKGGKTDQIVTVTVTGTNDDPSVDDVSVSATEDGAPVPGSFDGDDVDSDDDPASLVYAVTSTLSEGSVVNNNDGTFSFAPGADFQDLAEGKTRQVSFTYEATDSHGAVSNTGTVTVTVTGTNDAPVITSNGGGDEDSPSVAENTTFVTQVVATDVDAGTTLKYAIAGGADALLFKIDETTGDLSFLVAPNFESPGDAGGDNVYDVVVQASDGSKADTQTLHVAVTDVNEQPSAGADFAVKAAEDVSDAAVLATVVGTDPDVGGGNDGVNDFENLTYAIVDGNAAGLFEIDAATGEVSLVAGKSLNYEAVDQYVLTVRVTDGPGLFDDTKVTINVTDVNEQPSLTVDKTPVSFAEDTAAGTLLADVDGTDPDTKADTDADPANDAFNDLTYSIEAGNDAGLFEIDPATGEISLAAGKSFDFEATQQYVLTVRVTDGGTPGLYDEETVTINVTDVNEQPDAGADFSVKAAENVSDATVLATVAGTDPDLGGGNDGDNEFENLKYEIVAGNVAGLFEIDALTGEVSLAAGKSLDYETADQYVLTVRVSDGPGLFDETKVTINVTDVNEQPNAGADFAVSVKEDVLDATVLADVNGTDPDTNADTDADLTNDTFNDLGYAITAGNGAGLFEIDATSGKVSLVSGKNLDYETADKYVLTVSVTDGPGLSDTVDVTINVTDVNEAPVAPADFAVKAAENVNDTTVLATVVGTDPDSKADTDVDLTNNTFNDLSYAITAGNGAGLFEIDAATGKVSLVAGKSLDYETTTQYVLTVAVTDGPGLSDEVDVTVNVTDVNENAPPDATNDAWVLSDLTTIATGTITAAWFTQNDTDGDGNPLYVTAVTGLPAGLTANFDISGHLIDITGTSPVAGTYALGYTLSDGTATDTGSVALKVLDTTAGANSFTLDGNDFSYVDALNGNDTLTGDTILTGNAGIDTFIGDNNNDTLSGGAGNDTLFGNENTDTLNGGDGDDYLDGGNGTDIVQGDSGNDILIWDSKDTFDGGLNFDTLRVSGSLDLTGVGDAQIENIERVDLTDYGADVSTETLKLVAQDVLDLEASGNKLYVMGNESGAVDSVDIDTSLTNSGMTSILDGVTYVKYTGVVGLTAVEVHIEQGLSVI